ncbi:cadherin repeat domain-containing protein [Miniphocaeibacter halophilus]|uniref:Cadherin repeat domain-containing protein n=1 Tax=Miniphocaeibacter halophilus TaxID=2931922 RepID=A0AC61N0G3_9FIRM|nr:cadherin repeat domain-containing protein [Miniphocaeibacter halophilus]QQK08791.1 cadherin repeat domain-containing protein [Miniphocaeibacter halophilus]
MKRLMGLGLTVLITLGGICYFFGSDFEKPEDYNYSIINETSKKFSKLGISNKRFTTVLTDVSDEDLENNRELFFSIEDLNEDNIFSIQAIDKSGEIYDGVVKVNENEELIIRDVVGNKLVTNKDVEETVSNIDFNIKNIVKNWDYKVEKNKVKSKYISNCKNATKVMGKDLKVKSSDIVNPNEVANVSYERGPRNYSWINLYH